MRPTIPACRGVCFFKTAIGRPRRSSAPRLILGAVDRFPWSRPCLCCPRFGAIHPNKTARDINVSTPLRTIFRRGLTGDSTEQAAERTEALKANLIADLGHWQRGGDQQLLGAFQSAVAQVLMWRCAKCRTKGADEVKCGQAAARREHVDCHWLRVMTIDELAELRKIASGQATF